MRREQSGPFLSAVFVDYDNIYLSLRRKSEEAAKRFAKDASVWIKQIETGALVTPTNGLPPRGVRRIVMNRCYGNSMPRRNASDNSTDMSSFPFVRHHFLRAGFEVVDCPPLTAQMKNSSDIRMVMDLRDYLSHETHFDEFVILSGDADFTPVLHRLRAHARRTVIYATDYTAIPYTAISDGEVRESDLIALLLEGRGASDSASDHAGATVASLEATRRAIIEDVVATVRGASQPVPLEVLADRAVRIIGHDRTIGTGWAGAGNFRDLLATELPPGLRLSGEPPYVVIDMQRHIAHKAQQPISPLSSPVASTRAEEAGMGLPAHSAAADNEAIARREMLRTQLQPQPQPAATPLVPKPQQQAAPTGLDPAPRATQGGLAYGSPLGNGGGSLYGSAPEPQRSPLQAGGSHQAEATSSIQQSIARIHEACKAPPLAPPEYRALFEIITQEINENGLIGAQTIQNIALRAQERGLDIRRDDVRFVLEVVSEADPWFEQGASPTLFAGRFRNFVVARCRAQGLTLSADELDLVEAWFAGSSATAAPMRQQTAGPSSFAAGTTARAAPSAQATDAGGYWTGEDPRGTAADLRLHQPAATHKAASPGQGAGELAEDDFPRIVRSHLRRG